MGVMPVNHDDQCRILSHQIHLYTNKVLATLPSETALNSSHRDSHPCPYSETAESVVHSRALATLPPETVDNSSHRDVRPSPDSANPGCGLDPRLDVTIAVLLNLVSKPSFYHKATAAVFYVKKWDPNEDM
ncbi:hypothetical protein AVEN_83067-1 [Araneus ventricosus]|uniref:Uncharacterized protein n=1 Tax=Araneus ventricosus TaxID=182803 RepID=A0A4Y2APP3_ARAVE|nr:hypothetical protein AVEN_83067-1 [Araneus ventricosus]